MVNSNKWFPLLLIISSFLIAGYAVYVTTTRALTGLEGILLQFIILILGLIGSYYFGKWSAVDAAKEIIKPHARSAFRRLISLYDSLSRVGAEIECSKDDQSETITIAKLEVIVREQLATADDALEDWSDIVPDEVKELKDKLETRRERSLV